MIRPVYGVRAALWQLPREATPEQIRAAVDAALDTKGKPTMTKPPNDAEIEAPRLAADECTRLPPIGYDRCSQGYDHTGPCDWMGGVMFIAAPGDRALTTSDVQDIYPQLLDILTTTVRPLLLLPLAEMAAANEHMQALGPILAATAYRDGGGANLRDQRRVIDAALGLRRVLDSLAPVVPDGH